MKRTWLLIAIVSVAAIATAYAMTVRHAVPEPIVAPQGAAVPRPPGATLEVTYIANQGVLIAAGDTQVLIDGLHRQYRPAYPFLPEPYREQIETARPPFHQIDVILVSHVHLDHFHPESVARHLRHNTGATLVSSEQVVAEIAALADHASIRSRVKAITPSLKQRVATVVGGVSVELLGVGHGSGGHATVQNLGHLISLGGNRLLHIGDASAEDASIFAAFNLDEADIDVAFLPVWFLTSDEGAAIVRQHIKPKQIVAIHMPAGDPQRAAERIRERFPEAVPFTVLLEKKFYGPGRQ
jgi:L-ascorbate metabolism protein UlaG (beta-lactamase superfamily)